MDLTYAIAAPIALGLLAFFRTCHAVAGCSECTKANDS